MVVDGLYEWREEGGVKVPYRFSVKDDELFGLDAIYSVWYDKTLPDAPSSAIASSRLRQLIRAPEK